MDHVAQGAMASAPMVLTYLLQNIPVSALEGLMMHIYINKLMAGCWVTHLSPPGQNGCHFTDVSFECIFMNKKFGISSRISVKFIPKGPFDNKSAMVQVMAWRQAITWTNAAPVHWRIYMRH